MFPYRLIVPFMFLGMSSVYCELFTAINDLRDLVNTESILVETLEDYIKAEEHKLESLKRLANIYRKHHNLAVEDVQSYIANPINAYLLIKRLTADWKRVESLIETAVNHDFLIDIKYFKDNLEFPTYEDLNGAATALIRLQKTYRLDTPSLARGEINGAKYGVELSASDCFELGKLTYINGDYYHTQSWMSEAESRLKNDGNEAADHIDILEYLAFSLYGQGNISEALHVTKKLLEVSPIHTRALSNKENYENEIEKSGELLQSKQGDDRSEHIEIHDGQNSSDPHGIRNFEGLCRGDMKLSEEMSARLKCRYVNNNNPFLLIAPFKLEEMYLKPDLFMFHDVLSNREIETIKRLAQPTLKRAMVRNHETGASESSQYRISKSAWLDEHKLKHIANISRRIEDMTGLTMETAERLQVVNYGIGGNYYPHFDFARKGEKNFDSGNRIATLLFYMSDVSQGGATVFPLVRAVIWPRKGSSAFWYNLHASGDGDVRTIHGACPVLAGSKWVSNKWIHIEGQEFRRPCTLERPPEHLIA